MNECVKGWISEWMNEWINQSMNQSKNQWINESMSKWINAWSMMMNKSIEPKSSLPGWTEVLNINIPEK